MHIVKDPDPRQTLRGFRILVAEDEGLIAMLLKDCFADAGAQVIGPAGRVDAALRLVDEAMAGGGLNAAVLDLNLNGAWATPIADRLFGLKIPFLFVTGYCKSDLRFMPVQVIYKPFDFDRLINAVQELTSFNGSGQPSFHIPPISFRANALKAWLGPSGAPRRRGDFAAR